ncbi:MAG: type II toxin-antitoxin system RelB/DinJ family antitoxin [Synergistaceae bacterium]|nr:type II toxin-antitoxin system RelB/DinJ family antitoxin [Synergistaceae bacterium]
MAQTNLSVRIDSDLKEQFNAFCTEIGMSMSTAICIFAKKTVREKRIPFNVGMESDPFYSSANMARLMKSIEQMEASGGTVHEVMLDD